VNARIGFTEAVVADREDLDGDTVVLGCRHPPHTHHSRLPASKVMPQCIRQPLGCV
jgi:hypothetical protein